MPVALTAARDALRFLLWGDACERLFAWEHELDTLVFREQLATGSFRGRYDVEGFELKIMELVAAQGGIAPYYGMGGSRGAAVYFFRVTAQGCLVRVHHAVADAWAEEVVPLATEPGADPDIRVRFQITAGELAALRRWPHWRAADAFSSRYTYRFGIVSMGRGHTTVVHNHQSETLIDVTDYDDW